MSLTQSGFDAVDTGMWILMTRRLANRGESMAHLLACCADGAELAVDECLPEQTCWVMVGDGQTKFERCGGAFWHLCVDFFCEDVGLSLPLTAQTC